MVNFRVSFVGLIAVLAVGCGAADKPDTLNGNGSDTGKTTPSNVQAMPIPTPPPKAPALRLDNRAAPTAYQATLDLVPGDKTFNGQVTIDVDVHKATDHLWLNAQDITPEKMTAEINGETFPVQKIPSKSKDFLGLWLGRNVEGKVRLHLSYSGKISHKNYHGIFSQKQDKLHYIYTQFESTSARQAFPCFDEPSFKVPWQISIRTKGANKAFSNTPQLKKEADGEWTKYSFARTKAVPSYLIAFAVGEFDVVDVGKIGRNKIASRIIVTKGSSHKAKYAVKTLPAVLKVLEDYFDIPYPYAKLDQIEVPSFLGAMENPGLITYHSGILLAEPGKETVRFKRGHTNVVAHELAHQWFGNLVTLAWWNDTWLNEGFATWMALKAANTHEPEWDMLNEAVAQRNRVMTADSLKTSRAVRQPIKTKGDISGSFDSISYGKGAALLWMFERWIGETKFRDGIRNYLRKYSFRTAKAADFLAEIQAVSNPTVAKAFSTFLDQPGAPLVNARIACAKKGPAKLTLSQERFVPAGSNASAAKTWHVPVCISYGKGKQKASSCKLLTQKTQTIALDGIKSCPSWLTANADAVGYYRASYGKGMLGKLLTAGRKHLSVKERVGLIGDMAALVRANKASIGASLALVPALMRDKSRHVVKSAVGIVSSVRGELIPKNMRTRYARFVRKSFGAKARGLGWTPRKGESKETGILRRQLVPLVATRGGDKTLIRQARAMTTKWLATRKGVHKDLVGSVLATAAYHGNKALYDKLSAALKKEKDSSARGRILGAMAGFRQAKLVEANLALFIHKDTKLREGRALLSGPLARPETRDVAFSFVKKNFAGLLKKLPSFAHFYAIYSGAGFCDDAGYKNVESFFAKKAKTIPRGPKALAQTLEQIKVCTAFKKAQQPAVIKFLRRH